LSLSPMWNFYYLQNLWYFYNLKVVSFTYVKFLLPPKSMIFFRPFICEAWMTSNNGVALRMQGVRVRVSNKKKLPPTYNFYSSRLRILPQFIFFWGEVYPITLDMVFISIFSNGYDYNLIAHMFLISWTFYFYWIPKPFCWSNWFWFKKQVGHESKSHVLASFVFRLFDLLSNITYPNLIVG
jgi:hypothetical protein